LKNLKIIQFLFLKNMTSLFKKIFTLKNKVSAKAKAPVLQESARMNLKGQKITESSEGLNFNLSSLDQELYSAGRGPPMLNMKTRVKVWLALLGVGVYFYFCYKLILYRLKADDLDLMEREVNEEYKLKKKIKHLQ
jgi:hypothetical protein